MEQQKSKHKGHISPYVWQRHSFSGKRWPHSRMKRSFLMLVPWITLMMMGILFTCLAQRLMMRSGRVLDVSSAQIEPPPEGVLEEGMLTTAPVAILKRIVAPNRSHVTVLLLDEGRYSSDNETELDALKHTVLGQELNLIVDGDVSYGATMAWVERLKACQVKRINLVTTPVEARE